MSDSGYFVCCDGDIWQVSEGRLFYPCAGYIMEDRFTYKLIALLTSEGDVIDSYVFHESTEDLLRALECPFFPKEEATDEGP